MPPNAHIFLTVKFGTLPISGPNRKVPRRDKVFLERAKNFDGMQLLQDPRNLAWVGTYTRSSPLISSCSKLKGGGGVTSASLAFPFSE